MAQINNIFNFLKDYNDIRNPVITDIEKQNSNYRLLNLPQIKELWSIYDEKDYDQLKILEVGRPKLLPCPIPEDILLEWIDNGWDSLEIENISFLELKTKESQNEFGEIYQVIENFNDNNDRVKAFNYWIEKRNQWRQEEIPKKIVLDLYNSLFGLYSDIKREAESVELILGDGNVNWIVEGRKINHPILLQKVVLRFDADKPSFLIECDDLKTEIYTPMLRVINTINQAMLSDVIGDVENNNYHIADKLNNIETFKRLINVIDEEGVYVDDSKDIKKGPTISHNPTLFLRKRNLGFTEFINKVIEDIEEQEDISLPDFFETMIGNHKEEKQSEIIEDSWNQNGIDNEVLLTLPANNEQLKIIKYLDNYGAVLVQGPPGTGKTHTIANLIGHLLSRGDSVLVTSHTEKALSVLKDKVFKELQSLCISLLSSNSERKEMDSALFEIAEKSTSLDLNKSLDKINALEKERNTLIEQYKVKNQELLQIRSLQYKDIVFGNKTITPIDAAKFIKDGDGKIDYINGKTKDDTILLPLSIEDLTFLYKSNSLITQQDEEVLNKELPDLESIWNWEKFEFKNSRIVELKKMLDNWVPRVVLKEDTPEHIIFELLEQSKMIKESIDKMEDFNKIIINNGIIDNIYNMFWIEVLDDFEQLMIDYENYRKILFENEFNIPNDYLCEESIIILNEIIDTGKQIPISFMSGLTKPKWKKLRDGVTNKGKPIENKYEFENIRFIICYEIQRTKVLNKINKLLIDTEVSIGNNTHSIEVNMRSLLEKIKISLNWYDKTWISFTKNTESYIKDLIKYRNEFLVGIDNPIDEIYKLNDSLFLDEINNNYYSFELKRLSEELKLYSDLLMEYSSYGIKLQEIMNAFERKDIDSYKNYYIQLVEVYGKHEDYLRRNKLINTLKTIAPTWANEIYYREGIHGKFNIPEDIELAWKWRQLNNQIEKINSYDPNIIQKELNDINERLMNNAKKLAYEKAWFNKVENNTTVQTQAIEGWRQTMKQVGKGTGKRAPMLLKKARELMPLCQTAIPVWIMPLNRVADSFDPRNNKFDVVIIDEASQADILALSVLYLGKKIIIVGDDEQVSPDSVGIKTDEISAIIEQHLKDIPRKHLFNEKTSIYDMAKTSGFKPLMLTEHFRCLPEIIEFSNQLSYNGKMKPLRDASSVSIKPAVIEYRVPNGYKTSQNVNPTEAEHIASIICACIENESYNGKTIGVICLLGQLQAYEIDKLLQRNLDPKEYEDRRIQCGNPAQFQGDERDIIFLSVVEAPKEGGGPVRLLSESGNNDVNRKRYNVAASRAKDQMWVVHSLNPEIDLKPEDIRLRLIKHAMNPSIDRNEEALKLTESDFEKKVMKDLINKGYTVYPQWKVGAYRMDMVIEDGDNRIALECDGERWHTQDDLPNDLKRQAVLERLGWRFIRIRGSAYYRDSEKAMESVYEELESYGIKPNFKYDEKVEDESNEDILIDSIKRRADSIRREWNGEVDDKVIEIETDIDVNIQDDKKITLEDNVIVESTEIIGKDQNKSCESLKPKKSNEIPKPLFDFRNKKKN